jgi:hypothetical protein
VRRSVVLILVAGSLIAASPSGKEPQKIQTQAEKTAKKLLGDLKQALLKQLAKGGPETAIAVCRDIAPELAGEISRRTGWQVRRVGTRVRNPMLGMPDAWEQKVLAQFEKELAEGANAAELSHGEWVQEPAGKSFRYMKAIPTGPMCVGCHGQPDELSEAVRKALSESYPHDEATGYKPGDLRGAVSIRVPE